MIPRGKLYISNKDLLTGILYCFTSYFKSERADSRQKKSNIITCLSVRTGFDLILSSLNLPAGSEILVTDINIPDMFKIIAAHKLIAVPLPVNKHTLNISPAHLESAITPSTKAVLITHLFGAIMETNEINNIAKKHNLFVFEDCAQAYAGNLYEGNPTTDAIMFSFGLIKTNTAVSGAMLNIKDNDLYTDASIRNQQYEKQRISIFTNKLFKVLLIKLLTYKSIYTGFYNLIKVMNKDFDEVLSNFTKGFTGDDILKKIRYRPCLPNKKLLQKKLNDFNQQNITARILFANDILQHIPQNYKIGILNKKHTHWVLPIETQDPNSLINYLRTNGFDASQKASSLIKQGEPKFTPNIEDLTLEKLIYLPMDISMSTKNRNKLIQLLVSFDRGIR
ncbi:aminotransferase class V-fold PLP-dependent enzyme [Pedobacter frigoris]|uniref:aminotransferase class V-fold PLP-dependent enzyme n=1 Tax=Pedobacter frigoris TaxID=2571272 RepID=UPI00292F636D|nr:aminotransferase class V-fold PLP-dependent enzyme [Pedobacter frigoris]